MLSVRNYYDKLIVVERYESKWAIREIVIKKKRKWHYEYILRGNRSLLITALSENSNANVINGSLKFIAEHENDGEFTTSNIDDADFKDLRENGIQVYQVWYFEDSGKTKSIEELPELK